MKWKGLHLKMFIQGRFKKILNHKPTFEIPGHRSSGVIQGKSSAVVKTRVLKYTVPSPIISEAGRHHII